MGRGRLDGRREPERSRAAELTGISLLNPPLPSAPTRFVEAGVEIAETAGFGPGFANPALVGYPEAAPSGAGRRRFRQLT